MSGPKIEGDKVEASALAGLGLFAHVGKRDLGHVAKQFKTAWYRRGETVVAAGDPAGRLIVIVEGEARLITPEGEEVKRMGKGALIGELSVIDPAPRSATVEAVSDIEAITISSTAFLALLEDQPEISLAVMRTLVRRLRAAETSDRWHH